MVVSLTMATIFFVMGIGFMWLGAFFLWYMIRGKQCLVHSLLCVLPVSLVTSFIVFGNNVETVAGTLWGTIAFNLGMIGLLGVCCKVQMPWSECVKPMFWLGLCWLTCFVTGQKGAVGRFSGVGLVLVGIIAVGQVLLSTKRNDAIKDGYPKTNKSNDSCRQLNQSVRIWLILLGILLMVIGVWLVVLHYSVPIIAIGLPVNLGGALVIAPLCSASIWLVWRPKEQKQMNQLAVSLLWGNVLIATFGLGLVALCKGSLHLTQSTELVILPWTAGLMIACLLGNFTSQKTTRVWGGLVLLLYLGCVITLLV